MVLGSTRNLPTVTLVQCQCCEKCHLKKCLNLWRQRSQRTSAHKISKEPWLWSNNTKHKQIFSKNLIPFSSNRPSRNVPLATPRGCGYLYFTMRIPISEVPAHCTGRIASARKAVLVPNILQGLRLGGAMLVRLNPLMGRICSTTDSAQNTGYVIIVAF